MMAYVYPIHHCQNNSSTLCESCMKYTIFLTNLILLVGCICAFGFGLHMLFDDSYTMRLFDVNVVYLFREATSAYMLMGLFFGLIAFCGLWGSIKEVRCFLSTYSIIVGIIFIGTLTGFAFVYVNRTRFYESLEEMLLDEIQHSTDNKFLTEKWDTLHLSWKCCGVKNNVDDWPNSAPVSCCGDDVIVCTSANMNLYNTSCLSVFFHKAKGYLHIFIYLGSFIILFFIVEIILSCKLTNKLK